MAGVNPDDARLSSPDGQGVRVLTLSRPSKANALDASLVERVHHLLDGVGAETRLLVVTGAGRHFCGGFDFTGFEDASEGDLLLRFVRIEELLARLRGAPFATVARVRGAAYGAGADIACACTFRIGAADARLRFPGFQFGVALGTRRFAALVGAERAREILAGNVEIDAPLARALGLFDVEVDDPDSDDLPAAIAQRIGLDAAALATLLRLTGADTRDADLADLVRSVARPGLHARIAAYRQAR